jgi:eukaryotic-like serine/threonine-protein kinase
MFQNAFGKKARLRLIELGYGDQNLTALRGADLQSSLSANVSYQLEQVLGSGSMAVAFRAIRRAPDGQSFTVVKIVHPEMVMDASEIALLAIRKESVALGRLNEQVPPTPFVVRLLETSEITVRYRGNTLELPWLAMEYVHGGTLEERVAESVARTGYAFDPDRAAACVQALSSGIAAIHEVGVIHRDIKPSNILCCGTGRGELFKIADFGVSRSQGLKQTFLHSGLGTPGYAAPEQILMQDEKIGTATDVFALAATTYSLLTGEELFSARSITDILSMVQGKKRRSIRECARLVLDLRDQPAVCSAIDSAIAHATTPDPQARPQDARAFALAISAALRVYSMRGPQSSPRRSSSIEEPQPIATSRYRFHVRHALGDDRAIWSAAFDGAGSCLAASTRGLEFWDGTRWVVAPSGDVEAHKLRLVHYEGAGEWLIGGQAGKLGFYRQGAFMRIQGPLPDTTLSAVSGDFRDLAVVSGSLPSGGQALFACVGQHWLKPLELTELASLPALARIDAGRWLVAGRERSGRAFLAFYWPLEWRLERLPADEVRAYLAGASASELGMAVVVGAGGRVVRVEGSSVTRSVVPDAVDLSATAIEDTGRVWASSLGKLWTQGPAGGAWECVWKDARWDVPIVSLYADGRRLLGVTADGGMVEGLNA